MVRRGRPGLGARAATIGPSDKIYAPPRASKRSISVVTLGGSTQREVDHFVMAITSDAAVIRHTAPHLAQMAHGEFTIGFSNQCERNYSLDRPRWEVLLMWIRRRPKSRWINPRE